MSKISTEPFPLTSSFMRINCGISINSRGKMANWAMPMSSTLRWNWTLTGRIDNLAESRSSLWRQSRITKWNRKCFLFIAVFGLMALRTPLPPRSDGIQTLLVHQRVSFPSESRPCLRSPSQRNETIEFETISQSYLSALGELQSGDLHFLRGIDLLSMHWTCEEKLNHEREKQKDDVAEVIQ